MKASGISRIGLVAALILFHLIATVLFYYIAMPIAIPDGAAFPAAPLAAMQRNLAIFGFAAALATSLLLALIIFRLIPRSHSVKDVAEALRNPFLLLDASNRVVLCNHPAERVLGLSGGKDVGRTVDKDIQDILARGPIPLEGLDPRSVIARGERKYQVLEHPLPENAAGGRQRVVLFRDVTHHMSLRNAVAHINDTMKVLVANTQKISSSAASLSGGATRQADSLSAVSSSLDEFSKKIQGNTESSEKGTQLAAQAREAAERSGNEIAHALSAMTDVQDAGIRIARIVKLIDDIAFQTNLLALNAAVEAARAGRQGKGFAVVAGEVRNLAGRSAKAAKDTASMVEDVTERIGNASNYISRLEEMLRNIVHDAIRMADSSATATATSAEQASAILQVNQELNQMSAVTRNTMSEAEQTAAAVSALARQVDEIKTMLQEVASEFDDDKRPGIDFFRPSPAPAINLFDSPPPFAPHLSAASPYLSDDYFGRPEQADAGGARPADGFASAFKDTAVRDWDLNAAAGDGDQTLSDLLHSDGYEEQYREFLKERQTKRPPMFTPDQAANEPTEFKTTAEGDRVVKPGQSIQLDDAEFGRY